MATNTSETGNSVPKDLISHHVTRAASRWKHHQPELDHTSLGELKDAVLGWGQINSSWGEVPGVGLYKDDGLGFLLRAKVVFEDHQSPKRPKLALSTRTPLLYESTIEEVLVSGDPSMGDLQEAFNNSHFFDTTGSTAKTNQSSRPTIDIALVGTGVVQRRDGLVTIPKKLATVRFDYRRDTGKVQTRVLVGKTDSLVPDRLPRGRSQEVPLIDFARMRHSVNAMAKPKS